MTKTETIATAVTLLAETFRQQIGETGARGYIMALEDLTELQIGAATTRALRECKFMPTPAELRALVGIGGKDAMIRRSSEAWEVVRASMDRYDYTANIDFGPHVNAVVRNLGGWVLLCDKSIPDLVWVRKEFEKLYEAFDGQQMGERGIPLRGSFTDAPVVRVRIGNDVTPTALPPIPTPISSLIRDLADGKSLEPVELGELMPAWAKEGT